MSRFGWITYDPAVIDRELGYAEKLGLNCVRVFLQFAVYERDREQFLDDFESFLTLCENHHMQMMPVLFDSCFGDYPDLEKYRDKDWMACPWQNRLGRECWPKLEQYVRDVIGGHRNDRRIVMWDVMNEPTCTRFYTEEADKQRIHTFLGHFLDYVNEQNPDQPCTVGLMLSGEIPLVLEKVDVVGFHNYRRDLREDIRRVKELSRQHGKPAIINEVVRRPEQPFDFAMPILREEKIGWVFWELMLGKTQFSRNNNPIQGVVYPDGTCRDAAEVATILNTSVEEAEKLFDERPKPKFTEDGTTYEGFWIRWTGKGPHGDRLFYSMSREDTATYDFTGTSITLIHKVGHDCGIDRFTIDSEATPYAELDTYSPDVEWNHHTVLAENLTDASHTVVISPAGKKNPKSSNVYLQIVSIESGAHLETH